jgi:hypothetical protein
MGSPLFLGGLDPSVTTASANATRSARSQKLVELDLDGKHKESTGGLVEQTSTCKSEKVSSGICEQPWHPPLLQRNQNHRHVA